MIDSWPPRLTPFAVPPVDELQSAQEELHRASAAHHYLMIRPQRTTEMIQAANDAIVAAQARVAAAKEAILMEVTPNADV